MPIRSKSEGDGGGSRRPAVELCEHAILDRRRIAAELCDRFDERLDMQQPVHNVERPDLGMLTALRFVCRHRDDNRCIFSKRIF